MASDNDLGVVLVVGGCGYVGSNLVKLLCSETSCSAVHVMSRTPTQNLYPTVVYHAGDISNYQHVSSLLSEVKPRVIFHTASPRNVAWEKELRRTNIDGTRVLLQCAKETESVRAFVYTSSDSACAKAPGVQMTEDRVELYTEKSHVYPYSKTKAIADAEVQSANEPGILSTAVIRIPGAYGENDNHGPTSLIGSIKKGQHNMQVGENKPIFEFVYVEKACEAHILAAKALLREITDSQDPERFSKANKVNGEAFFVSDGVRMPFFDFARKLIAFAGYPVAKEEIKVIPYEVVYGLSILNEWLYWIFTLGTKSPEFSPSSIKYLAGGCQWDITKAKERLGYQPVADQDTVLKRVAESEAKRLGIYKSS